MAKRIKKPKKIRIKQEEKETRYGNKYSIFVNPPEELIPTQEDVGRYLEVAGYKDKDYFRLVEVQEKNVLLIDDSSSFRNRYLSSVILHRNEKIRDQEIDPTDLIRKARLKNKERKQNKVKRNARTKPA